MTSVQRASLSALVIALAMAVPARADIVYQVDQTGIGFDHGTVTGTIETDGANGTLAASDILNWNLHAA